jgi:bifunctional non-homologous end joining protein LigD
VESPGVGADGVRLTNPDRVIYPEPGITKLELAEYCIAVADRLLPHVAGRPLSIVRCPRGLTAKCFYQKHITDTLPEPIRAVPVREKEGTRDYVAVDDLAGVVTLVQFGVLEIHPWGCRADRLERPDRIVIDLDPGPDVAWERVVAAAQRLREVFEALGLACWPRTTGGKGLHVVLPIDRRSEWSEVKDFARDVVMQLAREDRQGYVLTASKAARKGRIFLDYFRNDRGATAVASYSPRARAGAPVATPLAWSEVVPALDPAAFTVRTVPARVARGKDPWAGFDSTRQALTAAVRNAVAT